MFKKLFSFFVKEGSNGKNGKSKYSLADHYLDAAGNPNSLGRVLLDLGYITQLDLDAAITVQQQQEIKLGIILMEMNMITKEQLHEGLVEQKIRAGTAKDHEVLNFTKNRLSRHKEILSQMSEDLKELTKVSAIVSDKVKTQ